MIKHLKVRFLVIVMTLLTLVLAGIIGGIYTLMLHSEEQQSRVILQNAVRKAVPYNDPHNAPFERLPGGKPSPSVESRYNNMMRNTIIIQISQENDIEDIDYFFGEEPASYEELTDTVLKILQGRKTQGVVSIQGVEYRYLLDASPRGKTLALLDRSIELVTLSRLVVTLLTIGGISWFILLVISLVLAKWAVKPIALAWEQQKNFVADASHELKTPLTIMNANIDVVLANPDDTVKNQSKWLLYSKAEGARMTKLITGLLYLARSDSGKEKIISIPFNISDTVTGVCLSFETLIYENGKTLDIEVVPDIIHKGDKDKIKQLVAILIDNAITHSDESGKIFISMRLDNKKRIQLSVANTGNPIPEEYLKKIFQRFYRTDESRARNTGGFGLGLSIAKSIAVQMGGTISVSSKTGELTTFTVKL